MSIGTCVFATAWTLQFGTSDADFRLFLEVMAAALVLALASYCVAEPNAEERAELAKPLFGSEGPPTPSRGSISERASYEQQRRTSSTPPRVPKTTIFVDFEDGANGSRVVRSGASR